MDRKQEKYRAKARNRVRAIILAQVPGIILAMLGIFLFYPKAVHLGDLRAEYQRRIRIAKDWDEYNAWYLIRNDCLEHGKNCDLLETADVKIFDSGALPTNSAYPEFDIAIRNDSCAPVKRRVSYTLPQIRQMEQNCYKYLERANAALLHPAIMIALTLASWAALVIVNYFLWGKEHFSAKRKSAHP